MAHPRWHHILMESQRHALKALDEWNCSRGDCSDFLTHMHKAWHYLLRRSQIACPYIPPLPPSSTWNAMRH